MTPVPFRRGEWPSQFDLGRSFYLTRSRCAAITDPSEFWRGYYAEQADAQAIVLAAH